jgi:hypothetical protein
MANSKISALTSATTPLAGTETLPVVQSSTTKQVSVANLTAGRAVSGLTFQSTQATGTAPFTVASTTNVANLNASSLNGATFASPGAIGSTTPSTGVFTLGTINSSGYMLKFFDAAGTTARGYIYNNGGGVQFDTQDIGLPFQILNGGYLTLNVTYSNITFSHSNLVQGTAGQGITTGSAINLGLGTNGSTTQANIDTSGNLLVGTTSSPSGSGGIKATGAITGLSVNGAYVGGGTLRINALQTKTITVAVSGTPNALRIGFGGDLDNNGAFWGVNYDVNGSMVVGSTYSVLTTNSYTSSVTFVISAVTKNSNNFTFTVTNANASFGGTIQYYFFSASNGTVTVS